MIDLHCHILPGIDDGAKDIEDSIEMAKRASSQGIRTIVATPHHQNGKYTNEKKDIEEKVSFLNKILIDKQIPVTILPGQESRIFGEMVEEYKNGKVLTLNNTHKYVFVEFPSSQVPRYTEQLLFNLQSEGLTPIIVHPERNSRIMEEPDILYNLVNKGALTQVTASSLTGHFGKKIQKFSNKLIECNLTHFVASDAHNVTNRGFLMDQAFDAVEQEFGIDMVYLFQENAEAVIEAKMCFKEPPEKIKRKKILGIF
ncbi:tyrosine-protein phosphatase [Priestia megaterium]|uniref:tyrosine-protein phosphatase n=1 Tax=Priestia megaterium TaxID=1404 RepID=UPI000EF97497|nr:CpsB/CapC family capsule biosynthesis tyrosine phosphatase [Priestia megaterium]RMA94446.1 protein-tyrosine phosphatase [Priestia megaterium]